jgi:hypothetical protein
LTAATAQTPQDSSSNKPSHIAYVTRPGKDADKPFWNPCGVAWAHKDGKGFRIKLDAVPVSGVIELRVNEPKAANDDASKIDWDFSGYGEGR